MKTGSFTQPLSPVCDSIEDAIRTARQPGRAKPHQDILVRRITTQRGDSGFQAWGKKRNPLGLRAEPHAYVFEPGAGLRARRIAAGTGQNYVQP